MLKLWKFTLFFLLCLVVALLINLPIQQVLPYVKLPATVQLAAIDGNLLKGRAEEVKINDFPIRGIQYRYMPSCIPLLKVCYQIDYDQGQVQLAYDVLNGDTEISRTSVEYPVARLLALLPTPALVIPTGRLQLEIDDMSMQQDKLVAVNGKLIWRDLGLDDDGIKIDIGDYQVDFSGDASAYNFTFSDLNAALDVSGDGSVSSAGTYEVDVKISAETAIAPQVKSILNLVAVRSSGNKYRIEQKGRLPANITRQLFR
jgi:Type II secretion system (T2SS), protein N